MRERILTFWRRLIHLPRRRQIEADLQAELAFHLSMKEQEGLSPKAARREMGNLTQSQEQSRDLWTFTGVEQFYIDVRHSCRVLAKNPIFTAAAVLTLAFGIGANTAIFTLIDALLLRGLPVPESNRMVQIVLESRGNKDMNAMSYPNVRRHRKSRAELRGAFYMECHRSFDGLGNRCASRSGGSRERTSVSNAQNSGAGRTLVCSCGRWARSTVPGGNQRQLLGAAV